ncbi:MAG: PilW family protein [Acidobacteria bacterium]|nr:PilW family protein [Acidobacteriota bacterium]
MVSIVVCLLVSLAAAGSVGVFGASQRQGVGVGAATVNVDTALGAIRDEVAAAGLGFFGDSTFLCSKLNLSVNTSVVIDGTDFTPVGITAETAGDRIDVLYGTQVVSGTNVLLKGAATGASSAVQSLLPVSNGQAVLLAPQTAGTPCTVRTVTATTASVLDDPQTVEYASAAGTRHNRAAFTTAGTYNDRARMTLLGELRWSRFRRSGTDLTLERPLDGTSAVLARNVMAFAVEYGLAAAGTTALASWQSASGAFATLTPANLPRVRALRVGIVTRSALREKVNSSGNCEATAAMPTLFDRTVTADVTDWQCYRYRTSIAVVPLRNLVLGTTP